MVCSNSRLAAVGRVSLESWGSRATAQGPFLPIVGRPGPQRPPSFQFGPPRSPLLLCLNTPCQEYAQADLFNSK